MNVFVDTSGLSAVLDADDDLHGPASTAWVELLENGAALHSTNYVLVETIALLQHRIGNESMRRRGAAREPRLSGAWNSCHHDSVAEAHFMPNGSRVP